LTYRSGTATKSQLRRSASGGTRPQRIVQIRSNKHPAIFEAATGAPVEHIDVTGQFGLRERIGRIDP
jgi:hypothetical protein